jgi:hypothetical protein
MGSGRVKHTLRPCLASPISEIETSPRNQPRHPYRFTVGLLFTVSGPDTRRVIYRSKDRVSGATDTSWL